MASSTALRSSAVVPRKVTVSLTTRTQRYCEAMLAQPKQVGIDPLEVVLRAHRAVDEGWQRLGTSIRAVPDANTDLEPEAIGRAVDQLDSRHAYLPVDEAADAFNRMVVADPHPDRVGEAGGLRVGESVLVQRCDETVDGAGADLENGFEVAREQVGHDALSAATMF